MEALRTRNARKSLLFAAVASAHALLIALLVSDTRTLHLAGRNAAPVSVMLRLPAHRRPVRFTPARPLEAIAVPVAPITAPITLMLPAATRPLHVPPPVNWVRAATEAAHAILRHRPPRVTIGFPKGARSRSALHSGASGVGSQGRESYRTRTGQTVYRPGGDCYVVSAPLPLDASQVEKEAQMSSVVCHRSARHGPPPDNLFKSLPAYKRYHSLPRPPAHSRRRTPHRRKRPPSPQGR